MQPQYILTYDQESGVKAGGGEFVNEGGPYICTIRQAKYTKAGTGSEGIEFSITTREGLKSDFLTVYYLKQSGEPITGGQSLLNAMMGILKLQGFTYTQVKDEYFSREFEGKEIGLFLQKVLYAKNNGQEGFKFEIRIPFHPANNKTLKELVGNVEPVTIERLKSLYKDKDERNNNAHKSQQSGPQGADDYGW